MLNNKNVYMILTNGFDPDVRVYKEAKYLVEKGFNVTILCWDRKCAYQDRVQEELEGIKIKRFLIPSVPGSGLKQIIPYFKFMRKIKEYLKDKEYTYLHCHDFDGILVGLNTKKRKEKKIVFDMHEIYTHYAYAKNFMFKFVFHDVLKRCNYIIYVNAEQIKGIENKEKLIYLPNYPIAEDYLPIEKNRSSKIRVNYIGALRDYKSLKALSNVKSDKIEIGLYRYRNLL